MFSKDRRSPSSRAIRACQMAMNVQKKTDNGNKRTTNPHLCTFNLPFISVAFVASPFCLQVMKYGRKSEILSVLGRWRRNLTLLGLLVLLLGLLLLLLVLLLMIVGLESAQHEYGISSEQDLNMRFQTYYDYINTSKVRFIIQHFKLGQYCSN